MSSEDTGLVGDGTKAGSPAVVSHNGLPSADTTGTPATPPAAAANDATGVLPEHGAVNEGTDAGTPVEPGKGTRKARSTKGTSLAKQAVDIGMATDTVSAATTLALGAEVVPVNVQRLDGGNPATLREAAGDTEPAQEPGLDAADEALSSLAAGDAEITAAELPEALTVRAVPRPSKGRMTPAKRAQARRDANLALRTLGRSLRGFRIEVPFCLVTPVMTSVYRHSWAEYLTATDRLAAHAIGTLGRRDGYEFMDRVMLGLDTAKEIVSTDFATVETEYAKAAKMKSKWVITDASTPMLSSPIVLTNPMTKSYLECLMQMDTTLQRAYSLMFLEVRDQLDLEQMEVRFRDLCYRTVRAVIAGISALHNAENLKQAVNNFEGMDRTKKKKGNADATESTGNDVQADGTAAERVTGSSEIGSPQGFATHDEAGVAAAFAGPPPAEPLALAA